MNLSSHNLKLWNFRQGSNEEESLIFNATYLSERWIKKEEKYRITLNSNSLSALCESYTSTKTSIQIELIFVKGYD